MFIDYLAVMLINMAAGLAILLCYLTGFPSHQQEKGWAGAFFAVGAVAFIYGLSMTLTWPLPGSYNIAFGEPSVLFGVLFLAAGFSIGRSQSLLPLSLYAFFAGIMAVVMGMAIINLRMTSTPFLSGLGFILTGTAGILLLPTVRFPKNIGVRILIAVVLAVGILIWAYVGYYACWGHLKNFAQWKP